MPISTREIDHVANLARLGLSETEKKKYSKELGNILDYFEKLKEADTEKIKLAPEAGQLINVFRKDENPHGIGVEKIKNMIGQAPERKDNFVKTKPILENK